MEHLEGKFEARGNKIYQKQTYIGGCAGYFEKTAFSDDVDEANAKELVRRWNAFEKDGLVDELVVAFKGLIKYHYHNDMGAKPKEYHAAEAAIAKVKA